MFSETIAPLGAGGIVAVLTGGAIAGRPLPPLGSAGPSHDALGLSEWPEQLRHLNSVKQNPPSQLAEGLGRVQFTWGRLIARGAATVKCPEHSGGGVVPQRLSIRTEGRAPLVIRGGDTTIGRHHGNGLRVPMAGSVREINDIASRGKFGGA